MKYKEEKPQNPSSYFNFDGFFLLRKHNRGLHLFKFYCILFPSLRWIAAEFRLVWSLEESPNTLPPQFFTKLGRGSRVAGNARLEQSKRCEQRR